MTVRPTPIWKDLDLGERMYLERFLGGSVDAPNLFPAHTRIHGILGEEREVFLPYSNQVSGLPRVHTESLICATCSLEDTVVWGQACA